MKKKNLYWLAFVLVLILGAVFLFKGRSKAFRSARNLNLLIITLDTTRADRIGAYGCSQAETPNLDSLAQKGIIFENCYSSVPITLPSHCSIFTGKYPIAHNVRNNGNFFLNEMEVTLAEKMGEIGFQTFAVISSFVLHSKFGMNQGFDFFDDSLKIDEMLTNYRSEIKADQVYANFSKWFQKRNKERCFFAWVHFYDPHSPFEPPQEYVKKLKSNNYFEAFYDGEVSFMDDYIGKIIDSLKAEGIINDTLIIIAGDHGEAFGEHGEFGHSVFCYEENLKVPLIFFNSILFPEGEVIKTRVNLIDIMPTVLDLYGIEKPSELHGDSLAEVLYGKKPEVDRSFYFESMNGKEENGWAPITGILEDKYKYISLPEPELYNLEIDEKEKDNIVLKKNKVARNMDKKLRNLMTEYSKTGKNSRRKLTGEDKYHLESLGYISSFSNKSNKNLDPKKGIALRNQLTSIGEKVESGEIEKAEKELIEFGEKNPGIKIPLYFALFDKIFKIKKDMDARLENWNTMIKKYPGNQMAKKILADFTFYDLKDDDKAEKMCFKILETNKKATSAYILLSRIEQGRDDFQKALNYLEKAILIEPNNISLKVNYCQLLKKNKNFDKAGEICIDILKDKSVSKDNGIKTSLGVILTEINRDDIAFPVLKEVLEMDKSNALALNYIGLIYFRKGNFEKSLESFLGSIKLNPGSARVYNDLGTLYLTMSLRTGEGERRNKAIEAFNKALELNPRLVSALNGRGSAFKFANRVHDAIKDWKKAIEIDPTFTDLYFNIGITYLQLKMNRESLKYLNICKEKFYNRLSPRDQNRLNSLIREAGG